MTSRSPETTPHRPVARQPVPGSTARAFWISAPGQGELRDEPLPGPAGDEVCVRALYSGISRGSETLVFRGGVPPGEYGRMRAPFQAGEFPAPVKYGYASVGRVEAGPAALRGRTVFCLYPHQDRYVVPASAVLPLPAAVPPGRAVLAANLETAVNALWDAAPRVGDRISVIGAGTLGCLTAWLAAGIPGCEVELVDVNPARAAIAAALGLRFAAAGAARGEADVVVHASGHAEGLARALEVAAFEATIIELSWYGDALVSLPLGEAFHARRLRIVSSQVGAVASARRGRYSHAQRLALAIGLLDDARLDALITGEDPFSALPAVMTRLATAPGDTLCHRIRYD